MPTATLDSLPQNSTAESLSHALRALAPRLISYQCELSALIAAIDADSACATSLIRFANRRKADSDSAIDSVQHAVIFLGLIDVKQFLFAYLLLGKSAADRTDKVQLLVRAKITATNFVTIGPLNKDLAFVATLLTGKKHLRAARSESAGGLFKMSNEQRNAIKRLDYGLRDTLKRTLMIEAKANPTSGNRSVLDDETKSLFDDAVYWANSVLNALH